MVWRSNHENTDSIQDATTWTYESQVYKAKTYPDTYQATNKLTTMPNFNSL